ncbi:hypothetical protein MTR_3g073075 [Medicago truncatula]|uniref:Uncharacterized protein n=1 Tax=Medicago truncatula TaxID=3880 RepID=A0A072UYL8_MEDTR|nr:hypothetical protein MTR_3g073075 [Medicago truncatula]
MIHAFFFVYLNMHIHHLNTEKSGSYQILYQCKCVLNTMPTASQIMMPCTLIQKERPRTAVAQADRGYLCKLSVMDSVTNYCHTIPMRYN